MAVVICTLFEHHYHYGLAALVNSLYKQGYRGDIFAGYKGTIPQWAADAKEIPAKAWIDSRTLNIADGLQLHFLPLTTDYHLTNYKPDFMLELLAGPAKGADGIVYFDPDIVVTAPWAFIANWCECGIAVCEDVNSPWPENHPHRVMWRKLFEEVNIRLEFKGASYVNGGFVGLIPENFAFLQLWKSVQEAMAPHIGGLSRSIFQSALALTAEEKGPFAPFGRTDQDALNAAIEAWDGQVSMIGKEAMGFKHGGAVMSHALGSPKPWKKNYLYRAIKGKSPSTADKIFWTSVAEETTIKAYKTSYIKQKHLAMAIAKLIGRFYKK